MIIEISSKMLGSNPIFKKVVRSFLFLFFLNEDLQIFLPFLSFQYFLNPFNEIIDMSHEFKTIFYYR